MIKYIPRVRRLPLAVCLVVLSLVVTVRGFGGMFRLAERIVEDHDPTFRKGLKLKGGMYCAQKEINLLVTRYVVVVTAKLLLEKNEFSFRLNGDAHLSWCHHSWFRYTEATGEVGIRPSQCFENVLKNYMLHSPVVKVIDEGSFRVDVSGTLAGLYSG